MKRRTTQIAGMAILFLITIQLQAQTLSKPQQTQQLDRNKIRLLTRADLSFESAALVSATETSKYWMIKVNVTVKNAGETKSPITIIKATAKKDGTNDDWKNLDMVKFPALNPGQSVTKELVFYDYKWAMHKIPKFSLKLDIDPDNSLPEINENNNSVTGILIGL